MQPTQLLNLTAIAGPFGLAFPVEPAASQRLSCDALRGRPFVTSIHVHRVSAPFFGREAYEFRIQCGNAWSNWTSLGPSSLVWATHEDAVATCPRPLSASGMFVSRGRIEQFFGGGRDLFGFTLICGSDSTMVDVFDLANDAEERRLRRCPEGSFVSAIEVLRGFEQHGAYDLYEFRLECSELLEPPLEEQPRGSPGSASSLPSKPASSGSVGEAPSPGEQADRVNKGGRGRAGRRSPLVQKHVAGEAAESGSAAAGAAASSDATGVGREPEKRGRPSGIRHSGAEDVSNAEGSGASVGLDTRTGRGREGPAAGGSDGNEGLEALLERLLREQRAKQAPPPREDKVKVEEADMDAIFGSVRESVQKSEAIVRAHKDTEGESDTGSTDGTPGQNPEESAGNADTFRASEVDSKAPASMASLEEGGQRESAFEPQSHREPQAAVRDFSAEGDAVSGAADAGVIPGKAATTRDDDVNKPSAADARGAWPSPDAGAADDLEHRLDAALKRVNDLKSSGSDLESFGSASNAEMGAGRLVDEADEPGRTDRGPPEPEAATQGAFESNAAPGSSRQRDVDVAVGNQETNVAEEAEVDDASDSWSIEDADDGDDA